MYFFFFLEPLFLDPYAGCFFSPQVHLDVEECGVQYLHATKFIDDKLLRFVNQIDGLKQVIRHGQETKNDSLVLSISL